MATAGDRPTEVRRVRPAMETRGLRATAPPLRRHRTLEDRRDGLNSAFMNSESTYANSLEHLYDELEWLDLHIARAVQHARSARRAGSDAYISDQAAEDLLAD